MDKSLFAVCCCSAYVFFYNRNAEVLSQSSSAPIVALNSNRKGKPVPLFRVANVCNVDGKVV